MFAYNVLSYCYLIQMANGTFRNTADINEFITNLGQLSFFQPHTLRSSATPSRTLSPCLCTTCSGGTTPSKWPTARSGTRRSPMRLLLTYTNYVY